MEAEIANIMRVLEVSEAEAHEIIASDKAVDRMKMSEVDADLNAEQKQAVKKMKQADHTPTVYNFTKRERKPNNEKAELIKILTAAIAAADGTDQLQITNSEREFLFTFLDKKYKVTLSAPRS